MFSSLPTSPLRRPLSRLALALLAVLPLIGQAEETKETEDVSVQGQFTYNWQRHPAFSAAYSGPNSLTNTANKMYTGTLTGFFAWRMPWESGELYINPEVSVGVPFTGNLVGLGGFTNGEITRAGGTNPTLYRQRLLLRQTWGQGGEREYLERGQNQLAGWVDKNRTVLTIGNFSTLDVFDPNTYAKDPRTQFMNWSNWTYAAYDYAADARGFGWGFALERYVGDWALRIGRMSGPIRPNELPVDRALGKHYGDQIEVEHAHTWHGQPGKVRVLAWRNRAVTAPFRDALNWLGANPGTYTGPDALFAVRSGEKFKYGIGVNVEQALDDDTGVFLRAMTTDGRTETYAFTEVDGSLSTGITRKGSRWGRPDDAVGIAFARNTLSRERRNFLAAGGISYFIGDGALRYRPEMILETFYSLEACKDCSITLDYQHIANPAYNADRGPVNVYAVRLHADF